MLPRVAVVEAGVAAGVATAAFAGAGVAAPGCMAASLAFTSASCCERSSIFFCRSSVEGDCAQLDTAPEQVRAARAAKANKARRSFNDCKVFLLLQVKLPAK